MKGFGFRKGGRRGMGGRVMIRPGKTMKPAKRVKQPLGGTRGRTSTFGFR